MFGKNKVSGSFNESGEHLLVNEVFYTIQGEGPDQGRTAIFVRLSKCNLRCYFCDTEFESGKEIGLQQLTENVLAIARDKACNLVVITGGEPLLQNIVPFVQNMNRFGLECSVETAGTVYYPQLTNVFHPLRQKGGNLMVCSPKTPRIHPQLEQLIGAWKYIIKAGETDNWGMPTMSTQHQDRPSLVFKPRRPAVPIWVQPMDCGDQHTNADNLAWAAKVAMENSYRLGVQVHKLAGLR